MSGMEYKAVKGEIGEKMGEGGGVGLRTTYQTVSGSDMIECKQFPNNGTK